MTNDKLSEAARDEEEQQADLSNWLVRAAQAFKEAIRCEVEGRRRRGEPIVVCREGRVVDLSKKD